MQWRMAAVMGNGGAMGSGMTKRLQWAMGWRRHNGRYNEQRTIATDAEAVQSEATRDERQWQSQCMAVVRLQWRVAAAMGNSGAMSGGMAKQSQRAMGRRHCNGQHNGQWTIAINAEAVQWEATQDGWQRQSQCTVAARLRWTVAVAMGNGGTMGRGTAKGSGWVMRWWQCNGLYNGQLTIAANTEAVQLEATQDGWKWRSSQEAKLELIRKSSSTVLLICY